MFTLRMGVRLSAALLFMTSPLVATAAMAHVNVSTPDAEAGGFGKLVFRVPSESETASTNSITVSLPDDSPFAFVSAKTKPGWKVEFKKTKHDSPVKVGEFEVSETVSSMTWTTSGAGIAPHQFDEFELSVGPFPDDESKQLVFKTIQGYDDGTSAAWDETAQGGAEPEHPAPTLSLTGGTGHGAANNDTGGDELAESEDSSSQSDPVARGLGGTALAVAAGALVLSRRKNGNDA